MRTYRLLQSILQPFSWIYGAIVLLKRAMYRKGVLKGKRVNVATISVGNIAVGGTGKTPHSQYIIDLLKQNFRVAFLSRGYKRKSKGYMSAKHLESSEINAQTLGDEPFMIFVKNPEIPVAVDKDRYSGAMRLIEEEKNLDAIVLDDAFQHLSLKCGLQILLTEYENPYFKDFPLPSGRLREWPCAAKDADIILVTKVVDGESPNVAEWRRNLNITSEQNLFFTKLRYKIPEPVTSAAREMTLENGCSAVVLTGIAHPRPFIAHIEKGYVIKEHICLPDHHEISENEAKKNICHMQKKWCGDDFVHNRKRLVKDCAQ